MYNNCCFIASLDVVVSLHNTRDGLRSSFFQSVIILGAVWFARQLQERFVIKLGTANGALQAMRVNLFSFQSHEIFVDHFVAAHTDEVAAFVTASFSKMTAPTALNHVAAVLTSEAIIMIFLSLSNDGLTMCNFLPTFKTLSKILSRLRIYTSGTSCLFLQIVILLAVRLAIEG